MTAQYAEPYWQREAAPTCCFEMIRSSELAIVLSFTKLVSGVVTPLLSSGLRVQCGRDP
jgi:hypothetical protein